MSIRYTMTETVTAMNSKATIARGYFHQFLPKLDHPLTVGVGDGEAFGDEVMTAISIVCVGDGDGSKIELDGRDGDTTAIAPSEGLDVSVRPTDGELTMMGPGDSVAVLGCLGVGNLTAVGLFVSVAMFPGVGLRD